MNRKAKLCWLALLAGRLGWAGAAIPEPDNVIYGQLTFGGVPVTAANTNVIVAAALQPNGVPIATYQLGTQPGAGDFYTLRVPLEARSPVVNPAATVSGQRVYLSVSDGATVRAQAAVVVGARGRMTRLDLAGANVGQTTHPADNNPADNALTINEVVAYTVAWRTGAAWPVGPGVIPVGYAVRAGALWRGGEGYQLDSTFNGPPAWWVNTNTVTTVPDPAQDGVVLAVPPTFASGVKMTVTNLVTPGAGVGVYAVENQPPAGWTVANVGQGGAYDPVNNKVKWGLYFDHSARVLTYDLTPAIGGANAVQITGAASFDGLVNVNYAATSTLAFGQVSLRPQPGAGGYQFRVTGVAGQSTVIETSTDLKTWRRLGTVVLGAGGTATFTDPAATNHSQFYRTHAGQ